MGQTAATGQTWGEAGGRNGGQMVSGRKGGHETRGGARVTPRERGSVREDLRGAEGVVGFLWRAILDNGASLRLLNVDTDHVTELRKVL